MTNRARIGIVGLGVMGRNLAFNMAEKGFSVITHDAWTEAREQFNKDLSPDLARRIDLTQTPAELVAGLSAPRTVLIMVKAGNPVDDAIESLLPFLQPDDTLIDGGNSHYLDTVRREAMLTRRGFNYIGLGISGGEEGARNGPSMMAGGETSAYENGRTVLETIAAKFNDQPCCALVGGNGAGHFVKMLHNGIEYGIMQAIAETYVLLRDLEGLSHTEMADLFHAWNKTDLNSYLVEITANILTRKDDLGDGPLVEAILDKAGQKGTGRWSSEAALAYGVPTPAITEAVFARILASRKEERVTASSVLRGPQVEATENPLATESIRQALLGTMIVTFAQGFDVISAGSREHGWNVNLGRVAAIWRNGCVIRATLLDEITAIYRQSEPSQNLMCAPVFQHLLGDVQQGWRRTLSAAIASGIPVPVTASALSYYDGYRSAKASANLIQAQRDYFGAHSYERTDRPGTFHTRW